MNNAFDLSVILPMEAKLKAMLVAYRFIRHAAHYTGGGGHDLEEWIMLSPERDHTSRQDAGVPNDAEYHSGYLDRAGRQNWVFVRRAPLSPEPCGASHCSHKGK